MDQEAAAAAGSGASPRARLDALRADVDALVPALSDAGSWSVDERRSALRAVDGLVSAASAVRAHLLLAERDAEGWRTSGAASFAQWRGAAAGAGGTRSGSTGSGAGAAAREERQAEALVRLPAVGAAVRAGALGLDHASVIGAVAGDRSERVREAVASAGGQAELVELARSQDVPAFARAVRRWADALDGDALEDAHEAQRRARFLHLGTTDRGTRISGRLDAVAGHRLRLALEAVTPRPAADDDRTAEQRAADALVALAENALTEPSTAPGAAVRPHVSVLVREETWRRHLRHRTGDAAATGRGPVSSGPVPPPSGGEPSRHAPEQRTGSTTAEVPEPATWEDGTPVPRSEVDRVLCDCDLTRVVLDADDVPLNLGRTRRTYTGVQRRAVIARDRACRWPGCAAQARWCEIHHVRWWGRDAGETSVANGVLLCSFHHHEVHRRDLAVSRVAAPARDAPAGEPGRRPGPQARAGRDGARGGPVEVDVRDPGGGVRYRFVSGDGRVVAGPGWTPTVGDVPVASTALGSAPVGSASAGDTLVGDTPVGSASAGDTPVGSASIESGSARSAGSAAGASAPGRVGRTWHAGTGRPPSRHHQDTLDGIPP